MELRIDKEDDRLTVTAILVKNGYRVHQAKRPRMGANGVPSKVQETVLVAEEARGYDGGMG